LAIIAEGQKDRAGIYNYVYDGETVMSLVTGESAPVEKELTGFAPATLFFLTSCAHALRGPAVFKLSALRIASLGLVPQAPSLVATLGALREDFKSIEKSSHRV
jgi:hypothetical protein